MTESLGTLERALFEAIEKNNKKNANTEKT